MAQEVWKEIEHDWPYGNLLVFRESLQRVAKRCAEIAWDADTNRDAQRSILQEFGLDVCPNCETVTADPEHQCG